MIKLKKEVKKWSSSLRIAHSQVQAECESSRETRQTLKNRVEAMKERMGEVIHKAADLRKERNFFEDSISR